MPRRPLLLALAAALALAAGPARAAEWKVVVHPSNGFAAGMSRQELSQLFLKKVTRWPSGEVVLPVEPSSDRLRAAFCRDVHGRSPNAIRAYWNQRIFSGRDVPPLEKPGDQAVLDYVRDNPDAIGYVSAAAATPGVAVVQVKD